MLQSGRRIAVPWYRRVLGNLNARHTTGNMETKGHGGVGKHIHCFLSPGIVRLFPLACGLLIPQGRGGLSSEG